MGNELDTAGLNRAGRRAAEKRAKRMRRAGAVLAAGAASFGTTATLVGVTAGTAGATDLTVTSLLDNGDGTCDATCTLRDAVGDAASGDTILFEAGLSGTITLDGGGDLDVVTSVTIQGPGAGVITVSGNNAHGVFNINGGITPNIDVVISGLTLTQGDANEGGAVFINNANSVTIRDSVLTGNHADAGGGAIEATDSDTPIHLTVENSDVSGNTSSDWGGGLYFYSMGGSLTLTNSTFNNNDADSGGGAGWVGTTGPMTFTNITAAGNNADSNQGGAFAVYNGPVTITGSTVTGNTTDEDGGGFYFDDNDSVTIESSNISNNTAAEGGGGILAFDTAGLFSISNSSISGNTAGADGGGLYLYGLDGGLSITNTTISGNTAEAGGGIWAYSIDGDAVNIVGSVISGNHATDGYGGGLYLGEIEARTTIAFSTVAGNSATQSGGGIEWYEADDVLRILNSTVSGNTATNQGGGLYVGFYNEGLVEIFNSTISGNTAGGEGGGIALAGSYYGMNIAQSTITGNTGATVGGLAIYCFEEDDAQAAAGRHHGGANATEAANGPHKDGSVRARSGQDDKVHAKAYGDVSASGTIISGNAGADVGECGTVTSDHSLIGSIVGTTFVDVGGTILGKLPLVAPLANNGGPTQTHALLPDSPAINAGPVPVANFEGNQNDQRGEGFPRVVAGVVDIGAYEVQPIAPNFTG